jgi:UDP-glucose 4-epimerase
MTEKQIKNKLKNSLCLIAGGAGFIGSSMCKRLLKLNVKVICFDNLSTGTLDNLKSVQKDKDFLFIRGDVNNIKNLEQVFKEYDIDYVFHYAAMVGVERTLENPLEVLKDLEGIKNILELSRLYKVKKVIFSSSSEVYGDPVEYPQKEDSTPLNTRLPYAVIKSIGEIYFENYYKKYKIPTTSLRFFNVYGPNQNSTPYGFVTAIFIKQALNNEDLTVFGDGSQTRDFVYIDDNINATLLTLFYPESNGQSINIGTNKQTTILSLAKKIIKISNKKNKIKFCSPRKIGDMKGRCPDISKMKKILKYKPLFDLGKGLKLTFEWYKKNDKIY